MAGFERFAVAAAPFPYVERPVQRRRPCLLAGFPDGRPDLVWVLMITSAANEGWPGDIRIADLARAGLPHPSVVRTAKIATVEVNQLKPLGRLADRDATRVHACLKRTIGADRI